MDKITFQRTSSTHSHSEKGKKLLVFKNMQLPEKFKTAYNSKETEEKIYRLWEESGFFNPDICVEKGVTEKDANSYSVVLPPVNVTGVLHIGHAYEDSLQDAVVRFERMRGKKTLFIPGTDSAAIATQARVEKNILKDEGKTRHDLGREETVRRVEEFAKKSEGVILNQVRRMGASLDWSRYAYTLDEKRNHAVMTAFKRMYDAGLIYRGDRIVNWDPKGQTTISDDEVVHEEREATLYTFRYSKDFPIPISTTRLETKVGDTAVAVHPDDPRYKDYIGKEFDVVFCDVPLHITIVADESVDPEFGTGALGVTPAHSVIDWEIADRHNLPRPQVINEYAKITVSGRLEGAKVLEAREIIKKWLLEENLLEKEEAIEQNVSLSERTGAIIEPLPKLQWWINVSRPFTVEKSTIPGITSGETTTLKDIMRAAVQSGMIAMPQENFQKIYFHWIDNLRDWCISRQIWFGHRIPIWYKDDEIYCDVTAPKGEGWEQDPDVLDTWFSSALWTFSTLGWPDNTEDLRTYHPTSFMSPGYEILPLWVARMILMSGFHLGEIPFETVLIHGLVRDKTGRKFSKSLGNGVDPLEIIDAYGADALRMSLLVGTAIGNDIKFDENKVRGYKNFSNKIWNAARFVLENLPEEFDYSLPPQLTKEDEAHKERLRELAKEVTAEFEEYKLYLVSEKLYHYFWHEFADKILEEYKNDLKEGNDEARLRAAWLLFHILETTLRLLHPFMPFITEEIWSHLPIPDKKLLMVTKWPEL